MAVKKPDPTHVDTLQTLLTTALDVVRGLADDPMSARLLKAFAALPPADREPILRVLERDATWCRIVEQTADTTGIAVRANPQASLFVHVIGPPSEPLQRDVDVISAGIEQFVAMMPLIFQEGVHEQWTASARDLVRRSDPEMLAYVARLAREVLALVDGK
jgi:hypothetical protein